MSGKVDNLWVRDSLVEDLVQAREGRETDVRAASDYIVATLERMDRKEADRVQRPNAQKKPGAVEAEYKRRTGEDMPAMSVDRNPQPRKLVQIDEVERVGRLRLAKRLRWIKSKPEMAARLKGLAVGLNSPKRDVREKAALKVRELLDESDRLVGRSWMLPDPQRLYG